MKYAGFFFFVLTLLAAAPLAPKPQPQHQNSSPQSFPVSQQKPRIFPDPQKFPMPPAYEPNVQFWMRVYGEWKDNQMILHDPNNMGIIVKIVNMPDQNGMLAAANK